MGVGDHQLDATQAAARQRAEGRRTASTSQKVSDSEAPMAMPCTSRRPSLLTPTAMVTATGTMRPASRTFTSVASSQRYAHPSPLANGDEAKAAKVLQCLPHRAAAVRQAEIMTERHAKGAGHRGGSNARMPRTPSAMAACSSQTSPP
jgi:hypothetical protein